MDRLIQDHDGDAKNDLGLRGFPLLLLLLAGGALVGLLIVGHRTDRQYAELSARLSMQRQSIETVTSIRRDARKTHVAMIECWLSPPEKQAVQREAIRGQAATVLKDTYTFHKQAASDDEEAKDRASLWAGTRDWVLLLQRLNESSNGSQALGELKSVFGVIDRLCNEILSLNSIASKENDGAVESLEKRKNGIWIATLLLFVGMIGGILLWRERKAAANRILAADRARMAQEHLKITLESLITERTSELSSTNARLQESLSQLNVTKCELEEKVHELTQTQNQLLQAQKLESVGQLASGIAHEINTPTQYVSDSIHFLTESFEGLQGLIAKYRHAAAALEAVPGHEAFAEEIKAQEDAADLEYILANAPGAFERAVDGLARISTIVRAMKEFAHPDQRDKAPADLNRALQTTLSIAHNEYKYVADIETELGELPPVPCHVGDLNQVFLNLIVNAAHAIGDIVGKSGAKGRIRVRTALENDMVRIEIEDTGGGIPELIRGRVFDPFFTTKEIGRGSGQGLAIARSIVAEKHGGLLTFTSEIGKGTTFTILLPLVENALEIVRTGT